MVNIHEKTVKRGLGIITSRPSSFQKSAIAIPIFQILPPADQHMTFSTFRIIFSIICLC